MKHITWRESDDYTITSFGSGFAYLVRANDGREFFLQGEDADEWYGQYDDYCRAITRDPTMQPCLDAWMADTMRDYGRVPEMTAP